MPSLTALSSVGDFHDMKMGGIFYVVTSRQARDFAMAYFCLLKMEKAIPRKKLSVGKLSFEKV